VYQTVPIHPRVLKEVRNEIAIALKQICDCSLASDELPIDLRSGYIIPFYKKGNKCLPNNYRPVSLTCIPCKVLESIIRDQLVVEHVITSEY